MVRNAFNAYEVIEELAHGAAVQAFLARPAHSNRAVVLKVLRAELAANTTARARFWDQASRCAQLSHPHLVQHLAVDVLPDGRPYLVTEYLEGEDLATHLRARGPVLPEALPRLFAPICDALGYLHGLGIVHRDLTQQNVFLCGGLSGFMPKLTNFGGAQLDGPDAVEPLQGALPVGPECVAPECIDGKKADARSDLYSLGVVMFEALAGKPPFTASSKAELLLRHLNEPPPPLPDAAQSLEPIVRRCLAKNPAERFQSAAELKAALIQELERPAGASENVVGNYQLLRLLGKGSMSVVYLGRHLRLGKEVAIKVLRPEHCSDRELMRRLFEEARTVNRINHEHIVEIHDFVEEASRAYCVMELLSGYTLAAALKKKPFTISRAVKIARQICSGLGAAHQMGVVHRDIKPENIFLTERAGQRDFVKILDFGVAKLLSKDAGSSARQTLTGTIVGTPRYMSPEQAAGRPVDHRADIYAVGVVLYEMLSGRPPFQVDSVPQLMLQIVGTPAPPLGGSTAGGEVIPPLLRNLVMSCLEKDAALRPLSVGQLRHLLVPWDPEEAPKEVAVAPSPRRGALRTAILSLLLIAVSGAWAHQNRAQLRAWVGSPVVPAAAVPSMIRLAIGSTPSGAKVVRADTGEALGATPLIRELPRGEGTIVVRLERAGSKAAERTVPLNEDTVIDVALTPEVAPAPPEVPAPRPAAPPKISPSPEVPPRLKASPPPGPAAAPEAAVSPEGPDSTDDPDATDDPSATEDAQGSAPSGESEPATPGQ